MSPASSTRPYGACSYVWAIRRATAIALRRPEPLSPSKANDTSSSAVTQACGGSVTSGGRPGRKSSRQRTRFHSHVHGLVSWSPGDLRGRRGLPASGGREAADPQLRGRLLRLRHGLAAIGHRHQPRHLDRGLEREPATVGRRRVGADPGAVAIEGDDLAPPPVIEPPPADGPQGLALDGLYLGTVKPRAAVIGRADSRAPRSRDRAARPRRRRGCG